MSEKAFNLLQEGWILAKRSDGAIELLSLLEVFRRAPQLHSLAGELPTQDFAVLRLLLAVLHASLGKREDGSYAAIAGAAAPRSPGLMKQRWKTLWDMGAFPLVCIDEYLLRYQEHFWLFHPTRPFYQIPSMDASTDYTAAKLNGVLSESGNKIRLFPQRAGEGKKALSFAEAARWLLYVNGFDDTSAKPTVRGLPSPGAGWIGQLGSVAAVGNNLFETLMLNLVFLPDGNDKMWDAENPTWKAEEAKSTERTEIVIPNNPSQLLTMQSRRLLLKREEDAVIGYSLLGGDFLPKAEEVFNEQMTLWRKSPKKEAGKRDYSPRRHNPARQLWRDFSALVATNDGLRRPGVVSWLARLKSDGLNPVSFVHFQTAGVKYGDKDFFADDVVSDSLTFSASLLSDVQEIWRIRVLDQVQWTDQQVEKVAGLAQELAKAARDTAGLDEGSAAREQAYYRLDMLFRRWLSGLEPGEEDDPEESCAAWQKQVKTIIGDLGRDLVSQAGPQAFVGRLTKENKKKYRYTAPEAYTRFLNRLSR